MKKVRKRFRDESGIYQDRYSNNGTGIAEAKYTIFKKKESYSNNDFINFSIALLVTVIVMFTLGFFLAVKSASASSIGTTSSRVDYMYPAIEIDETVMTPAIKIEEESSVAEARTEFVTTESSTIDKVEEELSEAEAKKNAEDDKRAKNEEIYNTKATAENSGYEHYLSDPGYGSSYVFTPEYNADGSVNYFGYTYEDFDYLSQCIAGEAGCCSWKWQMYVGSVVLNRVKHTAFSQTTIKSICLAPNQYACFNHSTGRVYSSTEVTDINKAVAYELLKYGSVLPYNVIYQAEFTQGAGIYEQIGNTYFCYINW